MITIYEHYSSHSIYKRLFIARDKEYNILYQSIDMSII